MDDERDSGSLSGSASPHRLKPQLGHGALTEAETERLLLEVQSVSTYFRGFKDDLPLLSDALSVANFDQGETILQEGEEGTWLGILLKGELDVQVNGNVVHCIKPGEVVGEMILWFGGVRQATVTAKASGFMGTILMDELRGLSLVQPRIAMQLMKVMGQQSVNTYLKFKSAMLLKQPAVQRDLIPLYGLTQAKSAETDQAWDRFIAAVRSDYDIPDRAAAVLKSSFTVFEFAEGTNIVRPSHRADFVLLVLQGAVTINTPQSATYGEHEFVGEYAFFQADQCLDKKLEVVGSEPHGLIALLPFTDLQQLCLEQPSLLYPLLQGLGQNAMAHARGERGVDVVAKQHEFKALKRKEEQARGASATADDGGGHSPALVQQMEVFYRKRMEKLAKQGQEDHDKLAKDAAKAEKAAHKAKTEVILLQKENSTMREEVTKLRQDNKDWNALRARNTELERRHSELVVTCKSQETQLRESTREYFTEAIRKKGEVLEGYRMRADFAEVENKELKKQLETLSTNHNDVRAKYEDVSGKYNALKDEFAETQDKLRTLQLATTMQDLEAAEERVEELESEVATLQAENESLEGRIQEMLASQQASSLRMKTMRRTSTFRRSLQPMPASKTMPELVSAAGGHRGERDNSVRPDDETRSRTVSDRPGLKRPSTKSALVVEAPHDQKRSVVMNLLPSQGLSGSDGLPPRDPAIQLVTTLQAQTRDLELQVESLEELQHALSTANMSMSEDCNTSGELIQSLQYKLSLSESLLLPLVGQMQQLQQSARGQEERIVSLLATSNREARLRKSLAWMALGAYDALHGLGESRQDEDCGDLPPPRVLSADEAAAASAAMESHAPLGPQQAMPLSEQLRMLTEAGDVEVLAARATPQSPAAQRHVPRALAAPMGAASNDSAAPPLKASNAADALAKAARDAAAALEAEPAASKLKGSPTDATLQHSNPKMQVINLGARGAKAASRGPAEANTSVGGWGAGGSRRGKGLVQLTVSLYPEHDGAPKQRGMVGNGALKKSPRTKLPGLAQSTSSPSLGPVPGAPALLSPSRG